MSPKNKPLAQQNLNHQTKASGTIGTQILSALLATNNFNITIISRDSSPSTFPSHPSITLQKGPYSSPNFLASAFENIDAAIFALGFIAMGEQTTLIEAAAKAGVKWILPTEYAGDGMNEAMVESVPLFHPKRAARRQVEALAERGGGCEGVKWIGVATGPWMEFVRLTFLYFSLSFLTCFSLGGFVLSTTTTILKRGFATDRHLFGSIRFARMIASSKIQETRKLTITPSQTKQSLQRSLFGISPATKTATLYSDSGAFNSSTIPQAGRGIANLLSLPITNPSNPRASLSHYANNFAYISSFLVTQDSLFASIRRATGTTESEWTVKRSTIAEWIGVCLEGMKKGDMKAGAGMTYAYYMGEGKGGNCEEKAKADREVLGLQEEDLDAVVARAVKAGEAPAVVFEK